MYSFVWNSYVFCIPGKVAIAISSPFFLPKTSSEEDKEATERPWAFNVTFLFFLENNNIFLLPKNDFCSSYLEINPYL